MRLKPCILEGRVIDIKEDGNVRRGDLKEKGIKTFFKLIVFVILLSYFFTGTVSKENFVQFFSFALVFFAFITVINSNFDQITGRRSQGNIFLDFIKLIFGEIIRIKLNRQNELIRKRIMHLAIESGDIKMIHIIGEFSHGGIDKTNEIKANCSYDKGSYFFLKGKNKTYGNDIIIKK